MRSAYVLVLVAACSETATSIDDAECVTRGNCAIDMPTSALACNDEGYTTACVRPAGVTWIESSSSQQTVPLPAGIYYEDAVAGCMWAVVWPAATGFRVETAALGTAVTLFVPASYASDDCGHASYEATSNETVALRADWCSSIGRGYYASGGVAFEVDTAAGVVKTWGLLSDVSSSPATCR
jgi:hypothetical protein